MNLGEAGPARGARMGGSLAASLAGPARGPRQTLPMKIADQLLDSISRGQLLPGTRLNEAEIAERMGTSRGPVREALRYLQEAGLIEAVPHQGSYVIEPSPAELAEMVVMRSLLEGMAARIAVADADGTLEALDTIVKRMWSTVDTDDLDSYRELDWEFHQALCAGSGMETLTRVWMQLRNRIGLMMLTNTQVENLRERVRDHEDLVRQLRGAGPAAAERIVRSRSLDRGFAWLNRPVPVQLVDPEDAAPA